MFRIVVPALVAGTLTGACILYAAFQNNNQGEYFDPETSQVVWETTVILFTTYWVIGFVGVACIVVALFGVRRFIKTASWF